jgi:ketosteroid isomerase-like protein
MLDTLNEEGVDAALEWVAEDFHGVVPPELSAEPDTYDGHDGLRRYFDSFQEIVADLRFDAEELVEVTPDAVAARGLITGRGRESGIPVEMRVPGVYRIRDGKVITIEAFTDWDAALAAAAEP